MVYFFFGTWHGLRVFLTNLELTHLDAADLIDKGVIGPARSVTLDHSQLLIELWRKHS